jgi:hypothetical protein
MVCYIYNKPFFMLITKELEIRITGNVADYYVKNNIEITPNKVNLLPIELVNPNSHLIVDAKCDVCGKQVKIQYRRYNKSINNGGYYSCSSKCGAQKTKDLNMLKYGVNSHFETNEFKEKSKKTFLNKWGVNHFRQSEDWIQNKRNIERDKRKNTIFNKFLEENPSVIGQDDDNFIIWCEIHGETKIPKSIFSNRKSVKTELCTECSPVEKNISGKETLLYKLIREIYDGEIIRSHKVGGKEIDIFLPSFNIGFEFNGLWWHSEIHLEDNYHINKTKLCEKNGIRLVHIFEDDFDNKIKIIRSIIGNLIGKSTKIFARNCEVRVILEDQIVKNFLIENHLQGYVNSNINYGLYINDELISIMTFMKSRKVLGGNPKNDSYELIRFCNKLGFSVVGGASKLLSKFRRDYSPKVIISYCDISWANGSVYKKMGFEFDGTTPPNYHYIINKNRVNRIKFQKHKLVKEGFDPNLTEREIMNQRGYYRIYNCGNERYIMRNNT